MSAAPNDNPADRPRTRTRLVRSYPVHTLEEALPVAKAIQEANAGLPLDRLLLAGTLGRKPASSAFTMRLNSSARYGLTRGGYNDDSISLTPRGQAVVAPSGREERRRALIEAALQPEPFRRFYELFGGKKVPDDTYAQNMLQRELGVQSSLVEECLRVLKANGIYTGILGDVGGSLYVSLSGAHSRATADTAGADAPSGDNGGAANGFLYERDGGGRIFIGHWSAADVVDAIADALGRFGIPHTVVEIDHTDGRPVAQETSRLMRGCDAAVLVFAGPPQGRDGEAARRRASARMLCHLGAASVLYGGRVLSLVESGLDVSDLEPLAGGLTFQRDRLSDLGFALLAELHGMGVIEVRAGAGLSAAPAPHP